MRRQQQVGPNKERHYVYEGLYRVVEARLEPSKDGPKVCRRACRTRNDPLRIRAEPAVVYASY